MKPFSPESDAVIETAFQWLGKLQLSESGPIVPYRVYRPGMAFTEAECRMLREMAESAVWQERGGHAIRDYRSGEVVGRTQWLGMPEWARGFGMDKTEIKAIVEKAIAGESLGRKQRVLIQSMVEEVANVQATVIPF